jgi:hypothetical protein
MSRTALLLIGALVCLPVQAFDFPKRKSGLWEIETLSAARTGAAPKAQMCIDQKSDNALNEMGSGMTKKMCSKSNIRRDGNVIVSDSVCKYGESTITTHSVVTGRFDSAYKVETRSTYDPPMNGMKEGAAVIQARWTGPCKPDQKPGDMILPNGMKINMHVARSNNYFPRTSHGPQPVQHAPRVQAGRRQDRTVLLIARAGEGRHR